MLKKRLTAFFLMVLTVLWLSVIYGFSGENSDTSDSTSSAVTEAILDITVSDFSELPEGDRKDMVDKYNRPVRKLAHFSEYTLLGVLISLIYLCHDFRTWRLFVFSAISCILLATADEIHQIFVPGRACRFTDVLIDSSGSVLGILIVFLFLFLFKKAKRQPADTIRAQHSS